MAFETLDVLRAIGGDPDLAGNAFERTQHADRMRELAEEREAEAKRARAAENAELLAIANRAAGDPLGQRHRAHADLEERQAEVSDLEDKLAKARGRLESARSAVQFWNDRLLVMEEASSRSRAPDPLEQASARAADAFRQAREDQMTARQVLRSARQSQRRGRRELAHRSQPASVLTAEDGPVPGDGLRYRNGGEIVGVE
jgi:hypothetical protein